MSASFLKYGSLLGVLMLTACGNNGGGGNRAPQLSGLSDQSVMQDTPLGPLAFQVRDDGGADALRLAVQSSNAGVIANDGLALAGSGSGRTLTLTPVEDATGTARITLTATDAAGLAATASFTVQVNAVVASFRERTNMAFAKSETDVPDSLSGITLADDLGDDPAAFDAQIGPEAP